MHWLKAQSTGETRKYSDLDALRAESLSKWPRRTGRAGLNVRGEHRKLVKQRPLGAADQPGVRDIQDLHEHRAPTPIPSSIAVS